MMDFIESSVTLQDVAKTMKIAVARVEAEAHELDVYIGVAWDGKPAISVRDAAGLVSGAARRDHDHDGAWRAHLASTEAWEADRERLRAGAFQEAYDVALRQGRGAPAAASAGHEAARVRDFERKTPPPAFDGAETAPRLFTQKMKKAKEAVWVCPRFG